MQSERKAAWEDAKNILCIRLDSLGDVLMTTPAIRALKKARRGRKITLLTSPEGARLAPLIPEVDEVFTYQAPWMKATPFRQDSEADYKMASVLKKAGFDAAAIFTVFSQNPLPTAFLTYLANIPLRLAHSRENPYQLLTDWIPETHPFDNGRHEVRRQLDLVQSVGCQLDDERMHIEIPKAVERSLARRLKKINLDTTRPWVVIHPGATAPSRRYPPESFAAAADLLAKDLGILPVFTGGKNEIELVQSIQAGMAALSCSLAGQLDLLELAALLKSAPLLISNNTGPVHLAAALGTPVVDIYALTNPQHTPWMVSNRVLNYDVPCKYCFKSICPEGHHMCLRGVSPREVVQAACELLGITVKNRAQREAIR